MSSIMFSRVAEGSEVEEALEEAGWASAEQVRAIASDDFARNIHLAEGIDKSFYADDVGWEHSLNNNCLVLGGTGAGKTYGVVLPNLIDHPDANFVITDPKGENADKAASGLMGEGYEFTTLNTIDPAKSDGYDPLQYVQTKDDIDTVVEAMKNAYDGLEDRKKGDPYWERSRDGFIKGALGLLFDMESAYGALEVGEHVFLRMTRFLDFMQLAEVDDGKGELVESPAIYLIDCYERGGDAFPVDASNSGYVANKMSSVRSLPTRTAGCVIGEAKQMVELFDTPGLRKMYERDDMRFDKLDEGKRVIDIKISDNDPAREGIANMAMLTLFNQTQRKADARGGRLARNIEFVMDEFPNLGRIANFERTISTARSRGINFILIAQSIDQLDYVYSHEIRNIIVNNCDTVVYMGSGSSIETASMVSDLCGTFRVATERIGIERVPVPIERKVISSSEVGLLPRTHCIVKCCGMPPILARKLHAATMPGAAGFFTRLNS